MILRVLRAPYIHYMSDARIVGIFKNGKKISKMAEREKLISKMWPKTGAFWGSNARFYFRYLDIKGLAKTKKKTL